MGKYSDKTNTNINSYATAFALPVQIFDDLLHIFISEIDPAYDFALVQGCTDLLALCACARVITIIVGTIVIIIGTPSTILINEHSVFFPVEHNYRSPIPALHAILLQPFQHEHALPNLHVIPKLHLVHVQIILALQLRLQIMVVVVELLIFLLLF